MTGLIFVLILKSAQIQIPPLAQICGTAIFMNNNRIKTPKWKSKSKNGIYGHRVKLIVLEIRCCRKVLLRKVGIMAKLPPIGGCYEGRRVS